MLESILQFIEQLSSYVSVEVFAFIASFLEELIAPIPSPFVMTIAGSMAAAQGSPFWYLLVIAVIAAAGKTLGAIIWYLIAEKTEDVVLGKVGRYVGLTHKQVEQFGARFRVENETTSPCSSFAPPLLSPAHQYQFLLDSSQFQKGIHHHYLLWDDRQGLHLPLHWLHWHRRRQCAG